jgi:hypothetical protein
MSDARHLQEQMVISEIKWQSLRHMMTQLQHKTFDPTALTLTSVEDMQDIRSRAQLEVRIIRINHKNN